jgi:hypothetical protein
MELAPEAVLLNTLAGTSNYEVRIELFKDCFC